MRKHEIVRIVSAEGLASTDQTWAQCTKGGNLLFISGQVALDVQGKIVGMNDFEIQARRALDNLVTMLKAGGADLEDLMMITVFVTDMSNRPVFAKVREAYFRKNPPASTIVEVERLCTDGLLIEVNGVAVLQEKADL
jgi:enamine deaminase RidA (YjgF/YER057c/UK114 family)